jgi:hypothetical protein
MSNAHWLVLGSFGFFVAVVAREWAQSRREARERQAQEAYRRGYEVGRLEACNAVSEFRALDLNKIHQNKDLYGFGQCCRGCQRPTSVLISRKSEYWCCPTCGVRNASPLPREEARA